MLEEEGADLMVAWRNGIGCWLGVMVVEGKKGDQVSNAGTIPSTLVDKFLCQEGSFRVHVFGLTASGVGSDMHCSTRFEVSSTSVFPVLLTSKTLS